MRIIYEDIVKIVSTSASDKRNDMDKERYGNNRSQSLLLLQEHISLRHT